MSLTTYLRCDADHPNEVRVRDLGTAAGNPCTVCGQPLNEKPARDRERRPRRY